MDLYVRSLFYHCILKILFDDRHYKYIFNWLNLFCTFTVVLAIAVEYMQTDIRADIHKYLLWLLLTSIIPHIATILTATLLHR